MQQPVLIFISVEIDGTFRYGIRNGYRIPSFPHQTTARGSLESLAVFQLLTKCSAQSNRRTEGTLDIQASDIRCVSIFNPKDSLRDLHLSSVQSSPPRLFECESQRAAHRPLGMTRLDQMNRSFVGLLRKRPPFGRHSGAHGDSSWRRSRLARFIVHALRAKRRRLRWRHLRDYISSPRFRGSRG